MYVLNTGDGSTLTVRQITKLGETLHYYILTQKCFSKQGFRAISPLMNSLKLIFLSPEQQMLLIDNMVSSVLSDASEICGFHKTKGVSLHLIISVNWF